MCQGSIDKFPCHQSLQHNCEPSYWPGRVSREHTWEWMCFWGVLFLSDLKSQLLGVPRISPTRVVHRISGYLDLFRRYSLWFTIRVHPLSSPNTFHLWDIHTSWNCDFAWGYYTMHFDAVTHIEVWQNENMKHLRVGNIHLFIISTIIFYFRNFEMFLWIK